MYLNLLSNESYQVCPVNIIQIVYGKMEVADNSHSRENGLI